MKDRPPSFAVLTSDVWWSFGFVNGKYTMVAGPVADDYWSKIDRSRTRDSTPHRPGGPKLVG